MAETLSMAGIVLRVDPQAMYEKSGQAQIMLDNMRRCYNQMNTTVNRSESYWVGEAGELHRSIYRNYQKEAETIFRRLQEHVDELRLMGEKYETTERAATNAVEVLSSDVIM